MPIIKSAKKRVKVAATRQKRNNIVRNKYKTLVKDFIKKIEAGDMSGASSIFPTLQKAIDTATKKNILHANTAGRKVSRLAKMLKGTAVKAAPKKTTAKPAAKAPAKKAPAKKPAAKKA